MDSITINHENYKQLKKAYDKAVKDGVDQFIFEGSELVTKFAKYLLEHMRNVLKIDADKDNAKSEE